MPLGVHSRLILWRMLTLTLDWKSICATSASELSSGSPCPGTLIGVTDTFGERMSAAIFLRDLWVCDQLPLPTVGDDVGVIIMDYLWLGNRNPHIRSRIIREYCIDCVIILNFHFHNTSQVQRARVCWWWWWAALFPGGRRIVRIASARRAVNAETTVTLMSFSPPPRAHIGTPSAWSLLTPCGTQVTLQHTHTHTQHSPQGKR